MKKLCIMLRLFSVITIVLAIAFLGSCKKLDLKRHVAFKTDTVVAYGSYIEVTCHIIDFGENEKFDQHGVCWSSTGIPTISNLHTELGPVSKSDNYSFVNGFGNLDAGTAYSVRPYAIAGDSIYYGEVTQFNNKFAPDSWTLNINTGGDRRDAVGFASCDKGYFGTGFDAVNKPTFDFWEFDPVTNTLTQKADFNGMPRGAAIGFYIDGMCYLGLGTDSLRNHNNHYKDIRKYDPSSNTWSTWMDLDTGLYKASVFTIGMNAFITGGIMENGCCYSGLVRIDAPASTFNYAKYFPGTGRFSAGSFACYNIGYIACGINIDSSVYLNDLWQYDPIGDTWVSKNSIPGVGRSAPVSINVDNLGYVGLGFNSSSGGVLNDFYSYNPDYDTWNTMNNSSAPRCNAACFNVGVVAFMVGGFNGNSTVFGDIWQYTP